jgi:hypothetical protein
MTPRLNALFAAASVFGHATVFAQTGLAGVVWGLSELHWALIAVALALAIGLVVLRVRRRRALQKASAYDAQPTMFAHTMVVESSMNQRTLPQPLAPHPHADQVWTTQ